MNGINFSPSCNNINKVKVKLELDAFGIMLPWEWHSPNFDKDFHQKTANMNPLLIQDSVIELYLDKLEEKMKMKATSDNLKNLTTTKHRATYNFKQDKCIGINDADESWGVAV